MSLRPRDDIYVTLPSNVPGIQSNTPASYTTVLPTPLKLNGEWEVALLECHYPHNMRNLKQCTLGIVELSFPGMSEARRLEILRAATGTVLWSQEPNVGYVQSDDPNATPRRNNHGRRQRNQNCKRTSHKMESSVMARQHKHLRL